MRRGDAAASRGHIDRVDELGVGSGLHDEDSCGHVMSASEMRMRTVADRRTVTRARELVAYDEASETTAGDDLASRQQYSLSEGD